jgi:hypothetical protein
MQYYKPWEMSAAEQDRIEDQIAEARGIIRRELEDYETRQEQESRRERRASTENDAGPSVDTSSTSKGYSEDTRQLPPVANTDGGSSPQDQDMKDDQATGPADTAAAEDHPHEPMQDTWPPNPEAIAEEANKDDDDDNGEEVVEAAEDTVIY